jgi:hypothetical protein
MKLSTLTTVAWCANMMLDRREPAPFTFDDIFAGADNGGLVDLLLKIDHSGMIELWASNPKMHDEAERALSDAAEALREREISKTGIKDNALCMVIGLVLEAIQQQHHGKHLD